MMRALDRKLWRDVWRLRVQALAIALVIGCGTAIFIMAVGMRATLERNRIAYYAEMRMADLAASAVRAPDRLVARLEAIPGVATVETRIAGYALLNLPGVSDALSARLVSLPRQGRPRVNDVVLAAGRMPDPARADEVLVNEAFAEANRIPLGARLPAVIYGRQQDLRVVGVANGPEFIYVAAPGETFPQPGRFGVIWMGREALARAYDLDGAFNDAVFRLARDADERSVIAAVDAVLRSYGGSGAYGRDRMISDRFITEELEQLGTMAAFLPTFFLVIAAFLVSVSQSRVVETERSNIGLLKAFGYPGWRIGLHYIQAALVFAGVGCLAGYGAGLALGHWMADTYRVYYRFPELPFDAGAGTVLAAVGAAMLAAAAGGAYAAFRARPQRTRTHSLSGGTGSGIRRRPGARGCAAAQRPRQCRRRPRRPAPRAGRHRPTRRWRGPRRDGGARAHERAGSAHPGGKRNRFALGRAHYGNRRSGRRSGDRRGVSVPGCGSDYAWRRRAGRKLGRRRTPCRHRDAGGALCADENLRPGGGRAAGERDRTACG